MIPNPRGFPAWLEWANATVTVLTPFMQSVENTFTRQNGIAHLKTVSVSNLPAVSPSGRLVFCSDETGGSTILFSDGSNWRRVQDRAIAS